MSGRQQALEAFVNELGRLGLTRVQGLRRSLMLNRLADLMQVSLGTIETMLSAAASPSRPAANDAPTMNSLVDTSVFTTSDRTLTRGRQLAEKEYLAVLLFEPDAASREGTALLPLDCFLDERTRLLAGELLPRITEGTATTVQDLHREVSDERIHELASHLWFMGQTLVSGPSDEYDPRTPLARVTEALQGCMDHAHTEQRLAHFSTSSDDDSKALQDILDRLRDQGLRAAAIHRDNRS